MPISSSPSSACSASASSAVRQRRCSSRTSRSDVSVSSAVSPCLRRERQRQTTRAARLRPEPPRARHVASDDLRARAQASRRASSGRQAGQKLGEEVRLLDDLLDGEERGVGLLRIGPAVAQPHPTRGAERGPRGVRALAEDEEVVLGALELLLLLASALHASSRFVGVVACAHQGTSPAAPFGFSLWSESGAGSTSTPIELRGRTAAAARRSPRPCPT